MSKFDFFLQNLKETSFNNDKRLLNKIGIFEPMFLPTTISKYPINPKIKKELLFEYLTDERIIINTNSCFIYIITYNSQMNSLKQIIYIIHYPHPNPTIHEKILISIPTYFLVSILFKN